MAAFEREEIERLLMALEEEKALFPEFSLVKEQESLRLLGSGGFSVVYEMTSRHHTEARYALKVTGFRRHMTNSENFHAVARVQRFLMEESAYVVRILAAKELWLRTTGSGTVCEILDRQPEDGGEFLYLQFVLMDKLETVISRNRFGKVSLNRQELEREPEVLKLGLQIGQTLLSAHKNQILHRDIKLENIFWDSRENCYRLGDFGAAKQTRDGGAETVIYTDGYGAPEIERMTTDRYDAAADIYSLGITLYLLLNGLKFPGSDGYHASAVQYHPDFVLPAPVNASETMARILRKMCSYHKTDRYGSMAEVLAALSEAADRENYADQWEAAPWMDLPTETYREETESPASPRETRRESRASRILEKQSRERRLRRDNVLHFCIFVFLFYWIMPGFGMEQPPLSQWQFWLLPAGLLMNGVFLLLGDLKRIAGIASAGLILFSAVQTELSVLHILGFVYLAAGMPVPMFALAGAIGLHFAVPPRGDWAVWLASHDFGWVLLVLLLAVSHRGTVLPGDKKTGRQTEYRNGFLLLANLPYLLFGTGILFWILGKFGILPVPELLARMHPVRTGLCGYAVFVVQYILWGLAEDDPQEEGEGL